MEHNAAITIASGKTTWMTPGYGHGEPADFLDRIEKHLGAVMVDPAGHPRSFVKAHTTVLQPEFAGGYARHPGHVVIGDGLLMDWRALWLEARKANGWAEGPVFVNWPYGATSNPKWAAKCAAAAAAGVEIVALCAARVGTAWWCRNINETDCVAIEYEGRMHFVDPDDQTRDFGATFDAAIVYWGPRRRQFLQAFEDLGHVR